MRIVGGDNRGRRLAAVGSGDTALHLRPTTDRVRESLFNLLAHGPYPPINGARVLDVFAGTGALGLEALSRGAASVTFIEMGRPAQAILRENIALLRVADKTGIIPRDIRRIGRNPNAPHDLIFMDPPYGKCLGEQALDHLRSGGWIAGDALIIWEEASPVTPPAFANVLDTRSYGDTTISILQVAS